jgi:hypothetical protein
MCLDSDKSLEQLEGEGWGAPTFGSHLVTECHRLRRVPLREFTTENLRIMIGQQIGLPYLVPIALESLRSNPFTAGDCYEGDLLVAVLRAEAAFWREHPYKERRRRLRSEHSLCCMFWTTPSVGQHRMF